MSTGWKEVTCYCHAGTRANASSGEPEECPDCNGGVYYVHLKSGTMARYPGGRFLGRLPRMASVGPIVLWDDLIAASGIRPMWVDAHEREA